MLYRVTTADGVSHDVPGSAYSDPGLVVGDTYSADNCLWWEDVVAGLRDHVPGQAEFTTVEVVGGAVVADDPIVIDAGAVTLPTTPEGEGGGEAPALSPEEAAFLEARLKGKREEIESRLRYHRTALERAEGELAAFEEDERKFLLTVIDARRRLTAAGVVSQYDSWDRKVWVDIGHVAPKRGQSPQAAVDGALLAVAAAVGSFDPDRKAVSAVDRGGKKVLRVEMPARRAPVKVRYTMPPGKNLACQIVKNVTVTHDVLCTVGGV